MRRKNERFTDDAARVVKDIKRQTRAFIFQVGRVKKSYGAGVRLKLAGFDSISSE